MPDSWQMRWKSFRMCVFKNTLQGIYSLQKTNRYNASRTEWKLRNFNDNVNILALEHHQSKWNMFLHLIVWIAWPVFLFVWSMYRCVRIIYETSFLCVFLFFFSFSIAFRSPSAPCLLSSIAAGLNDPNVITLSTAITKDNSEYLCVFQFCTFMLTICSQCWNAIHQNVRKWSDACAVVWMHVWMVVWVRINLVWSDSIKVYISKAKSTKRWFGQTTPRSDMPYKMRVNLNSFALVL